MFLPSKHLLSAFYKKLPSKNPSKNLVFTEKPLQAPSKNPSKKHLLLENLLRTLLRSVLLHDPLGVPPIFWCMLKVTKTTLNEVDILGSAPNNVCYCAWDRHIQESRGPPTPKPPKSLKKVFPGVPKKRRKGPKLAIPLAWSRNGKKIGKK